MGKHYPLKLQTMEEIIMAQEPITLLRHSELIQSEIDCAKSLIKNGLAFGFPAMAERGRVILRRIRNKQFMDFLRDEIERNKPFPLDEEGVKLLAERRTWFEKLIEEKENETTTPLP